LPIVAILSGSACAESLALTSSSLSFSSSPYFSTTVMNTKVRKLEQLSYSTSFSTVALRIVYDFQRSDRSLYSHFYYASRYGISVYMTATVYNSAGNAIDTTSTTVNWRFSNGMGGPPSYLASGGSFSADDGIWGFYNSLSATVDGNSLSSYCLQHNSGYKRYGVENCNGGDSECSVLYLGSSTSTHKRSVVYVVNS